MPAAAISVIFVAVFSAYPILVYIGLTHLAPGSVALLLVAAAALRLMLVWPAKGKNALTVQLVLALAVAIATGALVLVSDSPVFLRYYPVCMNVMLLCLFGTSLLRPPSMIERFARIKHPDLTESGVRYTRKVTMVWCAFFLVNGAIAFYTSYAASLEFWAIYNGTVSYLLIALLLIGEYLVRQRVMK